MYFYLVIKVPKGQVKVFLPPASWFLSFLAHYPESPHKTIPATAGPGDFDWPTLLSPNGDLRKRDGETLQTLPQYNSQARDSPKDDDVDVGNGKL
jgi:hypothetical protein